MAERPAGLSDTPLLMPSSLSSPRLVRLHQNAPRPRHRQPHAAPSLRADPSAPGGRAEPSVSGAGPCPSRRTRRALRGRGSGPARACSLAVGRGWCRVFTWAVSVGAGAGGLGFRSADEGHYRCIFCTYRAQPFAVTALYIELWPPRLAGAQGSAGAGESGVSPGPSRGRGTHGDQPRPG